MKFAVNAYDGDVVLGRVATVQKSSLINKTYQCWQCRGPVVFDKTLNGFTHASTIGRTSCGAEKGHGSRQKENDAEVGISSPGNLGTSVGNTRKQGMEWLQLWKTIDSSQHVSVRVNEKCDSNDPPVCLEIGGELRPVYDASQLRLTHYKHPGLGGNVMTFAEVPIIDNSPLYYSNKSIIFASDGEIYSTDTRDKLEISTQGGSSHHVQLLSLIPVTVHHLDLSSVSKTRNLSPKDAFQHSTCEILNCKTLQSEDSKCKDLKSEDSKCKYLTHEDPRSALVEFAEAVRLKNGWSNYSFALPDRVIESCIRLPLPIEDEMLENALGNIRFKKYGTSVRQILETLHKTNNAGDVEKELASKEDENRIQTDENADNNGILRVYCGHDVKPLSLSARKLFDEFHRRSLIETDPRTRALRVIQAPAGGGKSTLLLNMAKRWPDVRFGFVTFSKDLADDIRQRVERVGVSNVEVSTMDALCKRSEGNDAEPFVTTMSDVAVVRSALPWCKYGRAKGSSGIGNIVTYALNSTSQRKQIRLCPRHKPMENAVNAAVHNTDPGRASSLRNSFSGCRHRAFVKSLEANSCLNPDLLNVSSRYDCLLLDEVQDLTGQAVRILKTTGIPLIAVGDPLQEIFSFGDEDTCEDCKRAIETISLDPYRTDILNTSEVIRLYGTFRLNPLTCEVLEEWTEGRFQGVSLSSCQSEEAPTNKTQDAFNIRFVKKIPSKEDHPGMLVLCRTNKEVVEASQENPDLRIVQGEQIAAEIRRIDSTLPEKPKKGVRLTALQRIVLNYRTRTEGVGELASHLERQNISLDHVGDDVRAICTVHRAKGFEARNVTILQSVFHGFEPKEDGHSEQNVSFVGASRHTHSLSVLVEDKEPRSTHGSRGKSRQRASETKSSRPVKRAKRK